MAIDCTHLDTITAVPEGGTVCPTCVAMGSTWVNLRGAVADVGPEMTIRDGFPLGTWVATYRDRGRQGELPLDERAAPESVPGWTW